VPIKRQSVKVLRFWYRLSMETKVQELSHSAFRWLFGLTMQWTGHNNGAIEFTRRRHGPQYGLDAGGVFEHARDEVLQTGLVLRTPRANRNQPDTYALVTVPLDVRLDRSNIGTPEAAHSNFLGTPTVPPKEEILGTPAVPPKPKSGTPTVPSWYASRTKKTGVH